MKDLIERVKLLEHTVTRLAALLEKATLDKHELEATLTRKVLEEMTRVPRT